MCILYIKNRKVCTISFGLRSRGRGLRGCALSGDRPSGSSRSCSGRAIVFWKSCRRSFFLDIGIVIGGFGCYLICILRLIVPLESFDVDFGQRNNDSGTAAAFIFFGAFLRSFFFLYVSVCFCVCQSRRRTLQFWGQKFAVSFVILS